MINSNSQIVNVWTQEVCNLKQSKFSNRWGSNMITPLHNDLTSPRAV